MGRLTRGAALALGGVAATAAWMLALEISCSLAFTAAPRVPRVAALLASFSAHAVVALLWGGGARLVLAGAHRLPLPLGRALALLVGVLCLPVALLIGTVITRGEWISVQWFSPVLRYGLSLGLPLGAGALAWLLHRTWDRLWLRVALLCGSLLLGVINASVLPGLYLPAHLGLFISSTALALAAFTPRLQVAPRMRVWARASAALAISSLVASPLAFTAGRALLTQSSPGLAATLTLLVPPLDQHPLRRELEALRFDRAVPAPAARRTEAPSFVRPVSVLIVLVDTLRGDALPPVRDGDETFVSEGDTPFLNQWLQTAFRFENAYSQASKTKASIPPMFRSLEPFEDVTYLGQPLSELARELGLRPVAVVPQYFLLPAQARSQALLQGFESVEIYEKDQQQTMVPQARRLFEQLGTTPFFAWVHCYNMHAPYFFATADSGKHLAAPEAYRRALGWLDGQFGELMRVLQDQGLQESTLVLLAADHGEYLGEGKRVGHGAGVGEPEVHVPLAIKLPGATGTVLSPLVGNIDIVPTVIDILGHPPRRVHRGRSLAPSFFGAALPERSLYVMSGNESLHALLTQEHKLVYARWQGTFSLYARHGDPYDRDDLWGSDPALDRELSSQFVRRNPSLFLHELAPEATRSLLRRRLMEAPPGAPSAELEFLLGLAAASSDPTLWATARALFDRAEHLPTQLLISRFFAAREPGAYSERWQRVLERAGGGPQERELVDSLALDGFVAVHTEYGAQRVAELGQGGPSPLLESWLTLIKPWKKPPAVYAPALLALLDQHPADAALGPAQLRLVQLALDNVASFARWQGEAARALQDTILSYVDASAPLLAVAACRALAKVGSTRATAKLSRALDQAADARVRQAALYSLYELLRRNVLEQALRAGRDPLLTADAAQLLGKIGSAKALPFLQDIAKNHYNAWTRSQANNAIKLIRKRSR